MSRVAAGILVLFCWCMPVEADGDAIWRFQTSLYTTHFSPKPDHNNDQDLLGLEYYPDADRAFLIGGATFRNSFEQRSTYVYLGRRFKHHTFPVYAKLTTGLLYGYRGEYEDNIPFNKSGVAPAILPSVGVQVDRYSSEMVLLGLAGVMVNVGISF